MAISLRATGTVVHSTLTPSPSYPAGVQASDLNVLTVVARPPAGVLPEDVTCATPSGWQLLFAGKAGNVQAQSANIWIFTRTGSAFTGSVPLTLANHAVASAVITTYAGSLGTGWNTGAVYGYRADTSTAAYDSNFTVASSNLAITTGDWVSVLTGWSWAQAPVAPTVTAAGTVLGTLNQRATQQSTLSGLDSRVDIRDLTVTSGTSTAGPRMTTTTAHDGISVFVRLREGTNNIAVTETGTGMEKSTLGAQIDLPVTRDWVNGDLLDAATLNAAWRDPIAWLLTEAPGIQLEVTTVPAAFTTTSHTITWDKIRYRRGSMVVNGTKVSVPTAGHYVGQFSVGLRDNGTMGFPFVVTVDILTYPGGTGAATVHNVSTNYDPLDAESNIAIGSQPFSLYLNEGDAIEVKLSGAWNTAGGTQLWVASDAAALAQGFVPVLDLHWFSTWDGVSR